MPKIDVTRFMEQSGMRKARFGGYEPDDVRAALQALCTEYEQRLGRAEAQARKAEQENAALQQHCQTLTAQNNRLSGQNAALAGSSSTYSRQKESLDAQVSALQERNHSLNDQVAVLRLKNGSLQKEKEKLQERADQAEAALRIKGRELDDARNALENGKEEIMQEARQKAEDIVANAHVRADQIKEDAAAAIQGLKARGIKTVMLTGDSKAVAERVGKVLGVDEVHAELLPENKVEEVERLLAAKSKKGKLLFVGDGINDAPVLARADVGVAMGGLGSDAAIEAADVVIMTDEPSKLLNLMDIAKKTLVIAKQNVIFALAVKLLVLVLCAVGLVNMWAAVFADVGVSVLAILNAMRALKTAQK